MLRQIRLGVFETNSSSVHTLVIATEKDYEAFKAGEKIFDRWNKELIDNTPKNHEKYGDDLETYGEIGDGFEYFEEYFTTPSGDEMAAFGYYGYDG